MKRHRRTQSTPGLRSYHPADPIVQGILRAQTPAERNRLETRLFKLMLQNMDVTTLIIYRHDAAAMQSTIVHEIVALDAAMQERETDAGRTYDEADYILTYKWLQQDGPEPFQVFVDELPDDSEDKAEFLEYRVLAVLFVPIFHEGKLWGYCEMWESRRRRTFYPHDFETAQDFLEKYAQTL